MTQVEVVREMCRIMSLAYKSIGDYDEPSDGFCDLCPNSYDQESFRHSGETLDYVRRAVVEKLLRDGFSVAKGFDVEGKEKEAPPSPRWVVRGERAAREATSQE
jgi:hypothetical protein